MVWLSPDPPCRAKGRCAPPLSLALLVSSVGPGAGFCLLAYLDRVRFWTDASARGWSPSSDAVAKPILHGLKNHGSSEKPAPEFAPGPISRTGGLTLIPFAPSPQPVPRASRAQPGSQSVATGRERAGNRSGAGCAKATATGGGSRNASAVDGSRAFGYVPPSPPHPNKSHE